MTSRRSFITGLVSFVAAPAIVRVGSLMPVKVIGLDFGRSPAMHALDLMKIDFVRRLASPPTFILASHQFRMTFDEALEQGCFG
jgi:hypothetical protein